MADVEQTEGTGATQDATATTTTQATQATTTEAEPFDKDRAMSTISKLREFEKAGKAALKKLADLEAANAAAETDKLKQAGEYKTLLEKSEASLKEAQSKAERADKLAVIVQARLDRERKGQPKHILALLDKLPPEDQLAWIDENAEALAQPKAPNVNATDGRGSGEKLPVDQTEFWKKLGLDNAVRAARQGR